jgi:S-adenosyl methyltransferase
MISDETPAPGAADTPGTPAFDTSVAHQARMYDYLLGGKDNYAADRAAVEEQLMIHPDVAFSARANRAFLGRAVRYLAGEAGIRQFLDIGTGIPTAGNTHQVAQAIAPATRVVYVDYDPVVLAHARALLISHEAGATDYIDADLRDTGTILGQAAGLLDFTKPVAVTLVAILHVIPEGDDPYGIVATLMDAMPPGSYLAISHMASELLSQETRERLEHHSGTAMQQRLTARTREQVTRFFTGTDLLAPGLVRAEQWRPDPGASDADESVLWGAVGRKR